MSISISKFISEVGDEQINLQSLGGSMDGFRITKSGALVSFYTDPDFANAVAKGKKIGLVIWIDSEESERAKSTIESANQQQKQPTKVRAEPVTSLYDWRERNRLKEFDSWEAEIAHTESLGYTLVPPDYHIPHWSKAMLEDVPKLYVLRNGGPDELSSHFDCPAARLGYPVFFKAGDKPAAPKDCQPEQPTQGEVQSECQYCKGYGLVDPPNVNSPNMDVCPQCNGLGDAIDCSKCKSAASKARYFYCAEFGTTWKITSNGEAFSKRKVHREEFIGPCVLGNVDLSVEGFLESDGWQEITAEEAGDTPPQEVEEELPPCCDFCAKPEPDCSCIDDAETQQAEGGEG